jgi:uncharacterized repeat protein (TIGR02543 family)
MLYIQATANNDPNAEYLDLYIGEDVLIQRWLISGEACESFDMTPFVLGAANVTIGIQLVCTVGTWDIDGNITTLYRPSVAPDLDPYWTSPTNSQILTSHMGNIYFNYPDTYSLAGTFATETMGSGSNPGNEYTYFTGLTAAYPPCTAGFGPNYMQTKISIIEPDGHTILPNSAYSFTGFGGSPSGSTEVDPLQNVGVELLTGTSICLSVTDPALAAMFALAALITQYAPAPSPFSWTTDSTGIEMNYNAYPLEDAQSMLFRWSVDWQNSGSGVYTIIIQTTIDMSFGFPTPHATIVFNDSFLQYVPPTGKWPLLTISATSGGANPSTNPPPGAYTCSYGSTYPVTAYPATGYYFDHWSLDGTPYSTSPSTSVTMTTADLSLAANFSPNPTLTISASEGGTTSPSPGQYSETYGTNVTVTAAATEYWIFTCWILDGTPVYGNPTTVTMTATHSLTADFAYVGPSGCVLSGTLITMAVGKTVPVQRVKPGDSIMGYAVQTGTFVTETVTSNNCTTVDEILSINNGLLYVTPTEQPIYTDHGWVNNPQDIMIGWKIYNPTTNTWTTVQSLTTLEGHFQVYDLQATQPNTFIGNGILLDRKTGS